MYASNCSNLFHMFLIFSTTGLCQLCLRVVVFVNTNGVQQNQNSAHKITISWMDDLIDQNTPLRYQSTTIHIQTQNISRIWNTIMVQRSALQARGTWHLHILTKTGDPSISPDRSFALYNNERDTYIVVIINLIIIIWAGQGMLKVALAMTL